MDELDLLYKDAMEAEDYDLAEKVLNRKEAMSNDYGSRPEDMDGVTLRPFGIDTGIEMPPAVGQQLAGMGKRFLDIGSLGMRDDSMDAPLMNTLGGMVGATGADLSTLLGGGKALKEAGTMASGMLPRFGKAMEATGNLMVNPQGIVPAAAAGGGYEFATAPGGLQDRIKQGIVGTVGGAIVPSVAAMYNTFKSMIEPASRAGQERIAGEYLRRVGGDEVDNAVSREIVPGSMPTSSEVMGEMGNEGIPRLQETLRQVSPEFGNDLAAREGAQRLARRQALEGIAGEPAMLTAAKTARREATEELYSAADKYVLPIDDELAELFDRKAIKTALDMAKDNASNRGYALDIGEGGEVSGAVLHDIKKALDGMTDANYTAASGFTKSQINAIGDAKTAFNTYLKDNIVEYKWADEAFERLSKPINEMEAGKAMVEGYAPALADYGATTRETAASFARVLNKAKKELKTESGWKGPLDQMVSPESMGTIENVALDMGRKAQADDLMRGVGKGSNTATNIAGDRILRNTLGGAGIPSGVADWVMMQQIAKPLKLIYGMADDNIRELLGEAMLNPEMMARLSSLTAPLSELPMNRPLQGGLQYGSPIGTAAAAGYSRD